ncbi:thioredoxin family protein [Olivibacter sp. SDN3]|uniref:thioredoxin family protein n=1 Tax=Olivibacter sp. SDN3 TaxID=2764720 RepID=UPI0016512FD5|nr:thioredoxin family protein [Olivibacter sp. SDN3]QNL51301.1 thioredoxin family protein [Olivibacter sp. SDN3]
MNTVPQRRFDYEAYLSFVKELLVNNSTTGPDQSDFLVKFTALNLTRMQRIVKTFIFEEELQTIISQLKKRYLFIVITEAWCGDAAQILPIIYHIATANPTHIDLQLVLRDENPLFMDKYLTNGTRSIPKLIIYDLATAKEVVHWGPRPKQLQLYINDLKAKGLDKEEWIERVMLWYTKDKTITTQKELAELLDSME